MRQNGRRSTEAALALGRSGGLEMIKRPDPPDELTDEQAEEWRAIVGQMAADWFGRETFGLLCQYVRHVCRARRIAQLADEMERSADFDISAYGKLLTMEEEQSRAMSALATRMRISQQSSYDNQKKKKANPVKMPWDGYAGTQKAA
jgi:hypothetical protein